MTDPERLAAIDELRRQLMYLQAGVDIPKPDSPLSFSASQEE